MLSSDVFLKASSILFHRDLKQEEISIQYFEHLLTSLSFQTIVTIAKLSIPNYGVLWFKYKKDPSESTERVIIRSIKAIAHSVATNCISYYKAILHSVKRMDNGILNSQSKDKLFFKDYPLINLYTIKREDYKRAIHHLIS